jgi:glucose-1-phosphate adenylyltransferase
MSNPLAIVLAGGRGKRMDILCQERPKPILPFAGEKKVIDFTFSNCIHSKIKDIAVITDYQRSRMADYSWRWFMMNGSSCCVEYFDPGFASYSGTADAVFRNIGYLRNHDSDLVMVLAGDHIYQMDYRDMISFHRDSGADATVGVIPVPFQEAHRFGIVTIDKERRVADFVEKPRVPLSNLVSMGIYVFNKQALIRRLIEDADNENSPHDFGHAVIPEMVRKDKVFAYEFNEYWRDIGNPEAYFLASMELLEPGKIINGDEEWPILTLGYNSTITYPHYRPDNISNSLVSPGCIVKGRIENSILSPGVYIEEGTEIRDSILMDKTHIGRNSVVNQCIIDEKVKVGQFSYLGSQKKATSETDLELTLLGCNVTVPPGVTVRRSCIIPPYTCEDDFKDMVISPHNVPVPELYAGAINN